MERKEHFVKLTLSSNDQTIWIKIDSIVAFYADTNLDGEAVTKIHTMDDDYSIVKETPDFIHYAIDEYFNPEWYKEAEEDGFKEAVNPDFCDEAEGKIPEHIDKALDLLYEDEEEEEEEVKYHPMLPKNRGDINKNKAIFTLAYLFEFFECDQCPVETYCKEYYKNGSLCMNCVRYLDEKWGKE